jgi:hypothetical protein
MSSLATDRKLIIGSSYRAILKSNAQSAVVLGTAGIQPLQRASLFLSTINVYWWIIVDGPTTRMGEQSRTRDKQNIMWCGQTWIKDELMQR